MLISGETDKRPILLSGLPCRKKLRRSGVRISTDIKEQIKIPIFGTDRKEPGGLRRVGQEEDDEHAEEDSHRSVDKEEVLPDGEFAVEMSDCVNKTRGKELRDLSGNRGRCRA